ncbi:MAG: FtsX-like permease family protein [Planctomycetia bacterium]
MYRSFLSWRWMRTRKTNIIGVVGIAVGVGALIMILSIMTGFLEQSKKTLRGGLSDLSVEPLFLPLEGGALPPLDPRPVLDVVRADPRVEAACAQLVWYGIIGQGGGDAAISALRMSDASGSQSLSGVKLVGVDLADEYATTALRADLERAPRSGATRVADPARPFAPPPGHEPDGRPLASVVVGEQLARAWNLRRGDAIEVVTGVPDAEDGDFQVQNRRFVVAGTFRSGENEMDLERIYMDRAELVDFLGTGRQYSQVLVKTRDYDSHGRALQSDLSLRLSELGILRGVDAGEVRTWEDHRRSLLAAIKNERVLMGIMLSLVVLVAAFTIFAILSMMVTEKRRDIGILTALGATSGGVSQLFLLVAFWDALLGALAGAVLGVLGAVYIDSIEQALSKAFGVQIFDRGVYIFDHIPSVVNPSWVALIVLGAFLCTLLFALVPAVRAGRLHPLDALRHE